MNNSKQLNTILFILIILCLSGFTYSRYVNRVKQDIKPITLEEFNKRTGQKDKTVLVYFSASWCTVCSKMKPVIDEVEKEFAAKIDVFKIDTDKDKEVANEYAIDALPVLMLYRNGYRQWIYVGIIDAKTLKTKIES